MSDEKKLNINFKSLISSHFSLTIISVLLSFIVGALFLLVLGYNPLSVYSALINGIFSRPRYLAYSVVYATPLIFVGLSVAFSFKTGVFNIGAEGQFVVGAMAACIVGIFVKAPGIVVVPLCFIAACIAGCIWGIIVGILKTKWGINEVLSMIMFNWIAFYLSNYIVTIPSVHSTGTAEATKNVGDNARILFSENIRRALCPTSNYGIIIGIILVIIVYVIINKTTLGFELKAVGSNRFASQYAGINVNKAVLLAIGISGALAGMGGAVHVLGMGGRISLFSTQEGYGFDGIIVALMGLCEPVGVFFASLFYGALKYSGSKLNLVNTPSETVKFITGTIVFFIAISHYFKYLINKGTNKVSKKRSKVLKNKEAV